jgi:hypothetical protein
MKIDSGRGLSSGFSNSRSQSAWRIPTSTKVPGSTSTFVRRKSSSAEEFITTQESEAGSRKSE